MGHRLTRIYTRSGDNGTTGLADGSRVDKDNKRVQTMGDIDELNSIVGVLLAESLPENLAFDLTIIQHMLFNIGGELAMPGFDLVKPDDIDTLESKLDHYNASLSPLKDFILPGGIKAACVAHMARSVCRRAERSLVSLNKSLEPGHLAAQRYLNRLSDFLFVICRYINQVNNVADTLWNNEFTKT